jgi:carboxyl-terminal processing protease
MEYRETDTAHTTPTTPHTENSEETTSYLGIGLAILLATATFFSGMHLGGQVDQEASIFSFFAQEKTQADTSIDLTEFWEVWDLLEDRFVSSSTSTPVSVEERIQGAISGLVDSYGDPYTIYLPPEDASMFEEDISGNFGGVGMEVGMREGLVTVIAPLPQSPAEKAGVMPGDAIIKIDDVTTEKMGTDEAVRLIRGERGTPVRLTLYREGVEEFIEVSIVRDIISIPTSKVEKRDDVFIISLYSFNALSEAEMQNALRSYVQSGSKKLVIDLRGNPGGYLESAVSIASYFLPLGKVVVRESFGDGLGEENYRSSGKELGSFAPEKLVVLIDGGSASASEILAGALQEHGVATLIGAQTFGKGSVQELIELPDGSSLKVTIARWLTPNGNSISEGGLTPDIVVERTIADREANIDPQLDAALEFLHK